MTAETMVSAPCTVTWSRRNGFWDITVLACPFCGKPHHHGGGDGETPAALGGRIAHCVDGPRTPRGTPRGHYTLIETEASRAARQIPAEEVV